jgi:anti-sigma regulatory factor (Ser/Thr protein kinase)
VDDGVGSSPSGQPLGAAPNFELLLEADPRVLAAVRHRSVDWLQRLRWPDAPIGDAVTALNAAVSNSVQHAYGGPGGYVSVHALAASQGRRRSAARFTVRDWGRWRARRPLKSGYGIALMDNLSEDLYIETGLDGTIVILTTPAVALS